MVVDSSSRMEIDQETQPNSSDKNTMLNNTDGDTEMNISDEEQARQAIETLKGEDLSEKIAAANKLDYVAKVLGPERTREVRTFV